MFIWCGVVFYFFCLPTVVAGSNKEHCFVPAPSDEDTDPCPPWFIPHKAGNNTAVTDNLTVQCSCGPKTDQIVCDPETCNTSIHVHNCITYDPVTRTQVAGKCFETITKLTTTLPANVSELTNFICGSFNREGQLCGECKTGYGPTLFKYHRQCANCSTINYGWALYLLVEFLPITVFYVIIVTFQVSATSGPLNVFIFSAQLIASTMNENKLVFTTYSSQSWFHIVLQALITFYGMWNLDFFNPAIPPFCVSENITTLHALALQYLPAFYPLLLIVVTYILIELYT